MFWLTFLSNRSWPLPISHVCKGSKRNFKKLSPLSFSHHLGLQKEIGKSPYEKWEESAELMEEILPYYIEPEKEEESYIPLPLFYKPRPPFPGWKDLTPKEQRGLTCEELMIQLHPGIPFDELLEKRKDYARFLNELLEGKKNEEDFQEFAKPP